MTRVLRFLVKHTQRQTLRCTLQFRIEPHETIYLIERAVKNTTETARVRREERLDRHKRQTLSLPTAISFLMLSLRIYFNRILLVRWALRNCRRRLGEVSLSCWRQLMPSLSLQSFLLFRTTFLVLARFISINKIDHLVCSVGYWMTFFGCWDRRFESRSGHRCSLVSLVCCVGSGLCYQVITRSEESYHICVFLIMYLGTSTMRQPRSALGCSARGENNRRSYPVWGCYAGGRRRDP